MQAMLVEFEDALKGGQEMKAIVNTRSNTSSSMATEREARDFLLRICRAAAGDLKHILDEKLTGYRYDNVIKIAKKAKNRFEKQPHTGVEQAPPRLVNAIVEHGSWANSYRMQDMWAGLLASSATLRGNDESNLIFINLLSQISTLQAKILEHGCRFSEKFLLRAGGIAARKGQVRIDKLMQVTDIKDYHRLDRELDHLRSLGLIMTGFGPSKSVADITPTPLGLHMFVRCQGYSRSTVEYFKLDKVVNKKTRILESLRV